MTSRVICVEPGTSVFRLAAVLRENRIGGAPVVEAGHLAGIATEKDLLHRQEIGTEHDHPRSGWWQRFMTPAREPRRYVKSHGRCARHVMTRKVVTVQPATPLREVAALFDAHGFGRVPVLDGDTLVGIVASADLVKALAGGQWVDFPHAARAGDGAIRNLLLRELASQEWWNGGLCSVEVRQGVVHFNGFAENEAQREASCVAAENIPGVRRVHDARGLIADLPVMF